MVRKVEVGEYEELMDGAVADKVKAGYQTPYEVPNPTPVAPPVGYKRQPSLTEQIRAMVRSEALRQAAEAEGVETFEEADDFEVDDYDPTSPYEEVFDPVEDLRRARAYEARIREEADARDAADRPPVASPSPADPLPAPKDDAPAGD